jgi:hypothetical protein
MAWRLVLGGLALALGVSPDRNALADDVFEKPVRLKAHGKVIDTGPVWGHSSPCIEDVDGDGLKDLVLGDFSGKFRVYKNVGRPDKPVYEDAGNLQAGGEDASVRIYCCVGAQPRFLDLDGDGLRDFLSSSYDPGHCYFFRGLPDHRFAACEELLDKAGVPVRSAPKQKQHYQSFGGFYTPVDWDADGDFDILIGCFDGHLKLRINEGNAKEPTFAAENKDVRAGDEPLKVEAHCCPDVADWDGDGLWDVLAGSDDGSVTWFRNAGTEESPRFEKGVTLVEKHAGSGYYLLRWSEDEIVPGIRSQIEVVDHDGDGKLDLLLGDFCTAYEVRTDLTEEEKAQVEKLEAEIQVVEKPLAEKMEALRKEFAERYPGDAIFTEEADEEWKKAYLALKDSPEARRMKEEEARLSRQMRRFLAETHGEGDRVFDLAVSHGYVWLFLRK